MEDSFDPLHDQGLQAALAQLRKITNEDLHEAVKRKIRLEYLYNADGTVIVTRAEVKFEPVAAMPLTADMKLAWIDE